MSTYRKTYNNRPRYTSSYNKVYVTLPLFTGIIR